MAKIILFVDAMEPTEYGEGWTDTERGLVESGYPKVTPKVTGEVYTGMSPSENGMGMAHSMNGEQPHRPQVPMIQERLEAAGCNVMSLYMPYALPLQLQNQAWVSEAMQEEAAGQNPIAQLCRMPPTAGDMMDPEEDDDIGFNARVEDIYAKSSAMLNANRLGEFDVIFFSIRSPDQYTHFQWHEDYRVGLLQVLAQEVSRWEVNHEVLWWSDHGSEEKKETFRVNKWLMEKGYLDLEIDLEFNERFQEEAQSMSPQDQQQTQEIENQIAPQSPGVEIKPSSQAISMDPYDSCIDILDDDLDPRKLVTELHDTGMYRGVARMEEQWGDGQFADACPDIVTLRGDNVLVTGNVHPDPIGMGFYRSGVHSAYGAWGTTDDSFTREGDVTPQELHDVIWEFVTGESPARQEANKQMEMLEQQFEAALEG